MLDQMHPEFRVLAIGPPASVPECAELTKHFGAVASDYLQLVSNGTEIELQFCGHQ